jgi:hypothetical protein
MSDSSVSASVNTQLTTSFFSSSPQEFYSWFTFNMKLFVFALVIFVLLSFVFFRDPLDDHIMYNNINRLKKFSRGNQSCGIKKQIMIRKIPNEYQMQMEMEKEIEIQMRKMQMEKMQREREGEMQREMERGMERQRQRERGMERGVDTWLDGKVKEYFSNDNTPEMENENEMEMEKEKEKEKEMEMGNEMVGGIEEFSNDNMMSYSYEKTSSNQSIPLLALVDENNNPKNLFFGKADRYIFSKNSKLNYRLEIYCNLLVLNGNIYNKSKDVSQMYIVYLINTKTNEKIFLDELKKDGDGMYKLKFNSLDKNKEAKDFIQYDKIQIIHSINNKEEILLQGKFN